MKKTKLAIIQFAPVLGNLTETLGILDSMFESAREADWVVLPELANSGYNFENREEAMSLAETVEESVFLKYLQIKCREYDLKVATGFCEREGERLFNSALILDADGVIGRYRKLHLFMREKEIFEPGNLGLPLFDVDGYRVGMLVCFDWMFPEVWRKMALLGADVILHPSNLVLPYAQGVVPSYALVNRMFIATANRVGSEGELHFTGKSVVADPKGEVLVKGDEIAQVLMVAIDPAMARDKMITPMNHAFDDRRTDVYNL